MGIVKTAKDCIEGHYIQQYLPKLFNVYHIEN